MLQQSSILNLLDLYSETAEIFDNFLNGRYQALQANLNDIKKNFQYDYIMHDEKYFAKIRSNNLKTYVAPYRVLDMREIASTFAITLE